MGLEFTKCFTALNAVTTRQIAPSTYHALITFSLRSAVARTQAEFSVRPGLTKVQERNKQSDMRINNESRT